MKKIMLFTLLILVIHIPHKVFANITTTQELRDSLSKNIGNMAMTNAFSMSAGRDISSGYIGFLPHFSLEVGLAALAFKGIKNLYESGLQYINKEPISFSQNEFENMALGITPYIVTARVGGLKLREIVLPIDFAFSIGGIPNLKTKNIGLKQIDFNIDTFLIGAEIRTPIFTEQRILPGLSVGLSYGYTQTTLSHTFDMSKVLGSSGIEINNVNVMVGNTKTTLETKSQVIAMRIHANKTLLFVEPYLGIEPSVAVSSGSLEMSAIDIITRERNPDTRELKRVEYASVKEKISKLDFLTEGALLESTSTVFGVRFYGGTSLKIWALYLNMGIGYEPINDILTFALSGRITM